MMNSKFLIVLVLFVTLAAVSCKNRDRDKMPRDIDEVTQFATLPSFKAMYLALQRQELPAMTPAETKPITPLQQDKAHFGFAWGALSADLQMAVIIRDPKWAEAILEQLMNLAPKLALNDVQAKLKDNVRPMIAHRNWELLESTAYNMQYSVEQTLFAQAEYELYTLMVLGGWTQNSIHFGSQARKQYSAGLSRTLVHKEAWQGLRDNLELFTDKQLTGSASYATSKKQLAILAGIMDSASSGTLTEAQVGQALEAALGVKAAFCQV